MIARESHGSSAKICNPSLHTSETPEYPHLVGSRDNHPQVSASILFRYPRNSGH
jgi:hypothetical protein